MHICISGNLGSGKSTVSHILQEKLGFEVYSTGTVQRKVAAQLGIGTLELNELMAKDHHYDDLIDKATEALAQERLDSPVIFDSRMAWHFVKDAFKVYMVVDPVIAAERVINSSRGKVEAYGNTEEALYKLKERAYLENRRFQDLYGIDNFDYRNYNLIVDSTCVSPEKASQVICDEYMKFCTCPIHDTILLLSPQSLFPLRSIQNVNQSEVERCAKKHSYLTECISVIPFESYHYVSEGFVHVLAAVKNRVTYLRTKPQYSESASELASRFSKLSIFDLHKAERIANFTYLSYPEHYCLS